MGSLLDLLLGTGEFERDDAPDTEPVAPPGPNGACIRRGACGRGGDRIAIARAVPSPLLWRRARRIRHPRRRLRGRMADDPWAGADDRAADLLASGEPGLAALTACPHVRC
jgi:hypothetical protein